MSGAEDRIARVVALTLRLTEALRADIDALERGAPVQMRTIVPETQNLVGLYAREVAAIKPILKALSLAMRQQLTTATAELHDTLAQHERRISRVRKASEGMIRAIVEDVERKKRITRVYAPGSPQKPAPGAMLYNGVV